jgi:hypothetical protein
MQIKNTTHIFLERVTSISISSGHTTGNKRRERAFISFLLSLRRERVYQGQITVNSFVIGIIHGAVSVSLCNKIAESSFLRNFPLRRRRSLISAQGLEQRSDNPGT